MVRLRLVALAAALPLSARAQWTPQFEGHFGTGYSSLAYIKQLKVDELKIDRSFIRTLVSDPKDRAIVLSTIDLAHNLGLVVVAEGVEDGATAQLLRELGCDQMQGYHVSRPLEAPAFETWAAMRAASRRSSIS